MKKNLFLIVISLVLLFPFNVHAIDVDLFSFKPDKDNYLYDLANLYTKNEEVNIQKSIQKFHNLSNLDLSVITVNTNLEKEFIQQKTFNFSSYDVWNKKKIVTVVVVKDEKKAYIKCIGGKFSNLSLRKFEMHGVKEAMKYASRITKASELDNVIKVLTYYYIKKYVAIFCTILFVAMFITFIILKQIRKKYDISVSFNAKGYYDDTTIKFIK